ncbi:PadR family transcriptional regulator [Acidaminobacter sp. JC074]|uniref:PadR family transcriptional regulator n=1 Tax=Acidaminobacter sp. JC074 TaxID=2530199 RepID=UPI001F112AF5|nr:PadR family transcriptional regulator [Acidaminobacter sp. JC074]MCH4887773.1 PadR family transcriptional regulator [Acidaminobacter sp. JC074]
MKSSNAFALLGLLSIKPMTGYEMKKWVENALSHFWKTSYGQIYPTMSKFVEKGYVTVEKLENDKGPASKLYSLTEEGELVLLEWLNESVEDFNSKDEALLKFYFTSMLPIESVIDMMETSLVYNKSVRDKYTGNAEKMRTVKRPSRHELNTYLATKNGIYLNEARIKWQEECIETLKWYQSLED